MGSFINGLAKGFVRSAVNQVGRDAGRVVSNNIYGDAHSIPHRNVSGGGAGRVSSVGKIEDEGKLLLCAWLPSSLISLAQSSCLSLATES